MALFIKIMKFFSVKSKSRLLGSVGGSDLFFTACSDFVVIFFISSFYFHFLPLSQQVKDFFGRVIKKTTPEAKKTTSVAGEVMNGSVTCQL